MGVILPPFQDKTPAPKTPRNGGFGCWGGDNGKYFPNLYLKKRLHNKFQLTSTKIRGISLKGGGFTPKTPPERGFRGSEGGEGVN